VIGSQICSKSTMPIWRLGRGVFLRSPLLASNGVSSSTLSLGTSLMTRREETTDSNRLDELYECTQDGYSPTTAGMGGTTTLENDVVRT